MKKEIEEDLSYDSVIPPPAKMEAPKRKRPCNSASEERPLSITCSWQKLDPVYDYFKLLENSTGSRCLVQGCSYEGKGRNVTTMKRHLDNKHPVVYQEYEAKRQKRDEDASFLKMMNQMSEKNVPAVVAEEKPKAEEKPDEEKLPLKIVMPGEVKTTMNDIGGYEEAKLEVIEFVNFIKNKERYQKLGARLPKGALLHGPPGNGKTLLARATAGEGNIAFLSCSGSPLLVSPNGPDKLRKIFEVARKHAPCVLFFDEIDCLGRARNHHRSTPESQAMTEELLVQLDGFESHEESLVIVLGATNELYEMDFALQRPGRFDRVIRMDQPDLAARLAIFNVHLTPLKTELTKTEIAKKFAMLSGGFSGAQITAVCNESAMIAAREMNDAINMEHFEQALDRVRSGLRKRKAMDPEQKLSAAYHDAGHAVVGWFLDGIAAPVTKLCVLPNASGDIVCSQEKIKKVGDATRKQAINNIALLLAGRAAHKVFFGEYKADSNSDLAHATNLAVSLITEHGLCPKIGSVWFKNTYAAYPDCETPLMVKLGDTKKNEVFNEVKHIMDEAAKISENLITEKRDKVELVAKELVAKDMLGLEELEKLLGPSPFIGMDKLQLADKDFLPVGLQNWNN